MCSMSALFVCYWSASHLDSWQLWDEYVNDIWISVFGFTSLTQVAYATDDASYSTDIYFLDFIYLGCWRMGLSRDAHCGQVFTRGSQTQEEQQAVRGSVPKGIYHIIAV